MLTFKIARALVASATVLGAVSASASVVTMTFEGVGSQAAVQNFYNGGTDSQGNSGINYGVQFSSNALALRQSSPGAQFANAPSPETAMFFLSGNGAQVNVAAGFQTGFSFWYTTVGLSGVVNVYSGLNLTGTLLGSVSLIALNPMPVPGVPAFNRWAIGSVAFSGIARSIDFGGTINQVGYDNITLGSTNPNPPPVPVSEPGSLALAALALAALVAGKRRRKN